MSDKADIEAIQAKAAVLVEALPYVRHFRGSTFVVKYGGSFMDAPDLEIRSRVARDIVFLNSVGIRVVVVHGGGKAITRTMDERGIESAFIDGLRITDYRAIEIVDEVLNVDVNGEVAAFIEENDCEAERLPGKEVLQCKKLNSNPDLGFVGEITRVLVGSIDEALDNGKVPVISSTAADSSGVCYNVNADIAAAKIAIGLQARRLVYLSDVPGLLREPENPGTLISSLPAGEVEPLRKAGIIAKGMLPKVNSAVEALQAGVNRVHLVDGRYPHSLLLEIFTDTGVGTEIVH
ncbi:MAG: acetylglutamate kinase [Opitutae bacterium]|nr:acetylglutamate kinase [Opitutae bacterium]|tara:strand:+ start:1671 stop:2546 length:876 start_codon:yes stop_codon:yes gene_type:complete